MKRRHFISSAVGTATASSLIACARSSAESSQPSPSVTSLDRPYVHWRMATSWPKSLNIVFGAADLICQIVSTMTNGRFSITPYAAGEIVPGLEVLDAVQAGTVECGHTASYYYVSKNPALGFGTTVPFGLNAQQQNAWFYHGGGLEAMHRLYADFNIINFPAGNTGAQMGGWFKQEVRSIADLKGLKMRIPGLGGQVMKRLGVDAQVLPGDEIFPALEQGIIDAAEWVGPYEDERLGLNKIASYYYYPGWWEPGTAYEIQINLSQWDALPIEYQEIFKTAAFLVNTNMLAKYDTVNGEALRRLTLGGTRLRPYSEEILQAARQAALDMYQENAKDAAFRAVYEQWKTFQIDVQKWNQINELSFANFAFQANHSG